MYEGFLGRSLPKKRRRKRYMETALSNSTRASKRKKILSDRKMFEFSSRTAVPPSIAGYRAGQTPQECN